MANEVYPTHTHPTPRELEVREERRVTTNDFIRAVDERLYSLMKNPTEEYDSDRLLGLYVTLAHERHLQALCYEVEELVRPEPLLSNIDIDHPENVVEDPLGSTAGISETEKAEVIAAGKRRAVSDLLRILTPDNLTRELDEYDPESRHILDFYTMPWRKDMLKMSDLGPLLGEFTDGIKHYQGGIMTLNLKTRLPSVDYSLVYPSGSKTPVRYLYSTDKI